MPLHLIRPTDTPRVDAAVRLCAGDSPPTHTDGAPMPTEHISAPTPAAAARELVLFSDACGARCLRADVNADVYLALRTLLRADRDPELTVYVAIDPDDRYFDRHRLPPVTVRACDASDGYTPKRRACTDKPMIAMDEASAAPADRVCDANDGYTPKRRACSVKPMIAMDEASATLADRLLHMDDTFPVRLMKLMDARGMDQVLCYKRANVSKQTWYKILNEASYRPSKPTVLAFAIALSLTRDEADALLRSAGFALSDNRPFDVIIAYALEEGIYDIFRVNELLFANDQPTLGV